MAQELPDPSLPPSSGCAVDASHGRQPKAVFTNATNTSVGTLQGKWLVWWWWWWWYGRDVNDVSLAITHHVHAPNWSGRTPGSQTPGVPATPSPRQRRTLRHRGLKNGHSRPAGRSAKNAAKCCKITPPQNLNILSMNRSEAPPGEAGNLSLHITGTSTTAKELHLRHLHSFLQCLNHEHLSGGGGGGGWWWLWLSQMSSEGALKRWIPAAPTRRVRVCPRATPQPSDHQMSLLERGAAKKGGTYRRKLPLNISLAVAEFAFFQAPIADASLQRRLSAAGFAVSQAPHARQDTLLFHFHASFQLDFA